LELVLTIETVAFRDFARGIISSDILQLLDKRTKKPKGIYVSQKYSDEVLAYIQEKEAQKREAKKRALLDFVGVFGEGENTPHSHIKAQKYE